MYTRKRISIFNLIGGFMTLLLIGLLLPSGSALAKTSAPAQESSSGKYSFANGTENQSNFPTSRTASTYWSQLATPVENLTGWEPTMAEAELAANLVQDPSFESFVPPASNPYWAQSDNVYGTPLCNGDFCGFWSNAHPYNGVAWAWFGAAQVPTHTASLSQVVTFPTGGATLQFYFWIGYAETGSNAGDVFYAKIDGVTVFSANATQIGSYPAYTLVRVNVSPFANGAPHTIQFSHVNTVQDVGFQVDDVALFATATISGNAGVPGATLSYTDGTPKTVTANGSGNYTITVPQGWSGTVTPSKAGYTFSPVNRSYTNVTTNLTAQNYTARVTISGNAGLVGVTLSYNDSGPKTATSDGAGNYSITIPYNWSGVVTPSKVGYSFSPASRSYASVKTNLAGQNYAAVVTISGNVGASGIMLNYTGGSAISQANGNYSFTVPYNWSGTVTPAPTCYTFTPTSKTYVNVLANQVGQNYTAVFNGASGCSNISIDIGGVNQGSYGVAPQTSTRDSYPINNGPVKATSPNAVPFLIAERDAWLLNGVVQSFSEMMGLPGNQVTDTYYFPWYNNATMDTQLRFANLGAVPTDITVTIAGIPQTPITVAAGESTRVSYAGINAGPVKVQSSGGTPIIVAERDAWLVNGVVQSFSEMMGLPANQLTDTYYFPWYNNVTMDTQLRFANLGLVPTDITVTIAGIAQTPITVAAGESTRVSYPINAGPVKVQSTGGVPIIVAERDAWLINGVVKSFSEMMGLPGNQLTTTYHFPWYNNVTMDTQLRFANLGNASTNITVTIAGVPQAPIMVAAGQSTRISYAGINNGPVQVQSSGGVPIIVAERDAWLLNGAVRSFSEMMGLPGDQLTTTYYFPWYNNLTMDTQLRFAVP